MFAQKITIGLAQSPSQRKIKAIQGLFDPKRTGFHPPKNSTSLFDIRIENILKSKLGEFCGGETFSGVICLSSLIIHKEILLAGLQSYGHTLFMPTFLYLSLVSSRGTSFHEHWHPASSADMQKWCIACNRGV